MIYRFEDCALDPERRELRRAGMLCPLEPQVFDLLEYLVRNRHRVVSKDDVLQAVWQGRIVSEAALSTRIHAARKAIGDDGVAQRLIRTLRCKGIRFVGAVHAEREVALGNANRPWLTRSRAAVALQDLPSIAALPFANLTGDSARDDVIDGLTETVIVMLSRLRWLAAINCTTSSACKRTPADLRELARDLGVRYVLQGRVREADSRLRVTVELVDAATRRNIWAGSYDRRDAGLFAMQDDIAQVVAAAIEPRLYDAEDIRIRRKRMNRLDTWECIARALSLINSRSKSDLAAARGLLKRCISLEPKCAQGHSLLAYVTALGAVTGWAPRRTALDFASEAASKALLLDNEDPWAHVAAGFTLAWNRRAEDAVLAYEKALELDPDFTYVHTLLAAALCYLGRWRDALAHLDQAERLGPRDFFTRGNSGVTSNTRAIACLVGGQHRDGVAFGRKALVESASLPTAFRILVANLAFAGEAEQARSALGTLKQLVPNTSLTSLTEWLPFVHTQERTKAIDAFRSAGLR